MKTALALLAVIPAFALPASAGSSANYSIAASTTDHGGRRTSSPSYSQDATVGTISGGASDGASLLLQSGYVAQLVEANIPLQILGAVSRKMHGVVGAFDIDLPLTGAAGIECRSSGTGGSHQAVITFASAVTVGAVSVMSSDGQASAAGAVNGAVVTLDLTAVANAQTLGITLSNVSNGSTTGEVFVLMGVLAGDTTGNGSVTASDIGQTKAQSGQPVTANNFRTDINANGSINASDIGLVKSRSGSTLP